MKNTICKGCYFANPINSDRSCYFNIPNIIKDFHSIDSTEEYFKINNYSCRYGFSKKSYEENIDKFININVLDVESFAAYIKQQNIVQYSLALIVKNYNSEKILKLYNQLSILPYYITIISYNNSKKLHQDFSNNQPYKPYKVHHFLDTDISEAKALHIALETNKTKIGDLLWILTETGLEQCVANDSIQNINYMINVEQKPTHYYKSSNINSQLDGIFINSNNYWSLSKTINYEIENNERAIVQYYD